MAAVLVAERVALLAVEPGAVLVAVLTAVLATMLATVLAARLAVVAVLLGAAEARIAGSLGEGWHYLAPGLQLADLVPPPTRSPRQIIGSRSVCGHIVNNQGNVKICLLKRGLDTITLHTYSGVNWESIIHRGEIQ